MIDAQKGYAILPYELQRLDMFRRHLLNVYPEGIPKGDRSKPLSILSKKFIKGYEFPEKEIEQSPKSVKLEIYTELNQAKTSESKESEKRIALLYSKHLDFKGIGEQKGINENDFFGI